LVVSPTRLFHHALLDLVEKAIVEIAGDIMDLGLFVALGLSRRGRGIRAGFAISFLLLFVCLLLFRLRAGAGIAGVIGTGSGGRGRGVRGMPENKYSMSRTVAD